MLQRVYGTAFFDKKDLDAHLAQVEEAKKRDHRKLGKELGLFTISPLVGSGLILWMPKGAIVRGVLENFLKDELLKRGYQPVYTPHIGKIELYQTSGHYPYYKDSQFPPLPPARRRRDGAGRRAREGRARRPRAEGACCSRPASPSGCPSAPSDATERGPTKRLDYWSLDNARRIKYVEEHGVSEEYLLKPMNCPHHIQIYAAQPRSYRDLPVRLAEFGTVYRYEQSGELSGLTRVRGFTQDDAHLFCTEEQVRGEFRATMELTQFVLSSLGPDRLPLRLSKHDPERPQVRRAPRATPGGGPRTTSAPCSTRWRCPTRRPPARRRSTGRRSTSSSATASAASGSSAPCSSTTSCPSGSSLEYTGADNQPHRPVMIHRAPFGSMERFMGILIEHFAGAFPLWLAPEQVRVLPISDKFADYARHVLAALQAAGLRADDRLPPREDRRQDPRRPAREDPRHARRRRQGGRDRDRLLPRPRSTATAAPCRWPRPSPSSRPSPRPVRSERSRPRNGR